MTPPDRVPEEAFRMAMRELLGCDFLPEELDRALTAAAPAIRDEVFRKLHLAADALENDPAADPGTYVHDVECAILRSLREERSCGQARKQALLEVAEEMETVEEVRLVSKALDQRDAELRERLLNVIPFNDEQIATRRGTMDMWVRHDDALAIFEEDNVTDPIDDATGQGRR